MTPTAPDLEPFVPIRINAGGDTYTDNSANPAIVWGADDYYNNPPLERSSVDASTVINNTTNPTLYQTERWDDTNSPELKYEINMTHNGEFEVMLHFADMYSLTQGVGLRVFDVKIQDELEFEDLDIYGEVGGFTALVKTAVVNVTNNVLTIELIHVTQNPTISGIEVLSAPEARAPSLSPSSQPSLSNVPSAIPSLSPSATPSIPNDGFPSAAPSGVPSSSLFPSSVPSVTPTAPDLEPFVPIRINAGGDTYTDNSANPAIVWGADAYYNNPPLERSSVDASTVINNTTNPTLYQTERWDDTNSPELKYEINMTHNGELKSCSTSLTCTARHKE